LRIYTHNSRYLLAASGPAVVSATATATKDIPYVVGYAFANFSSFKLIATKFDIDVIDEKTNFYVSTHTSVKLLKTLIEGLSTMLFVTNHKKLSS